LLTVLLAVAVCVLAWRIGGAPWETTAPTVPHGSRSVHFHPTVVIIPVIVVLAFAGLVVVRPNQALVVTLFGRYLGTVQRGGLRWVLPLTVKQRVSMRLENFDSGILKVNDSDGRPVDIGTVVTFKVVAPAQALFAVANYRDFVKRQTEAILRHVASSRPYESANDQLSLRHSDSVAAQLSAELSAQVQVAGIQVTESRLSHLAYAAEVASAMLAQQQASAVVAARKQIVAGAVGIVDDALTELAKRNIELGGAARSALAANLLVVLCSDRQAQPVLDIASSP
jgi:hypothetical protein